MLIKSSTPSELPLIFEDQRVEKKMCIPRGDVSWIESHLKLHPMVFRQLYPDRVVNSLYFDDSNFSCFFRHRDGWNPRQKYRIRWYHAKTQEANFELKKRDSHLILKSTFPLDKPNENFQSIRCSQAGPALQEKFTQIRPSLGVSYRRSYWSDLTASLRVTIDSELGFWLPGSSNGPMYHEASVIVELKYKPADEVLALEFFRYWPLRTQRFSKYIRGCEILRPELS